MQVLELPLINTQIPSANSVPLTVKFFSSAHQLKLTEWANLAPDKLFFQASYLCSLEDSHKGELGFRYAIIFEDGKAIGGACFQILPVAGDAVRTKPEDSEEHDCFFTYIGSSFKSFLTRNIQKLKFNLLICGNLLITGEYGYFFKSSYSSTKIMEALHLTINKLLAIEESQNGIKIPAVLIKDFHPENAVQGEALKSFGYQEVEAQPNMILSKRDDWESAEDYLASLSSKYRVRYKKYRKLSNGIVRRNLGLDEINKHLDRIHELYCYVADNAELNLTYIQADYFARLKSQLQEKYQLFGYFENENLVGFQTLMLHKDEMEAHFIGYDPSLNRQYGIYTNMLYDYVLEGIKNNVKEVSFGRTATEIKSTLGAEALAMNCYMKHNNQLTNKLISPIVNQFRNDEYIMRNPFKNKEPNKQ